jgi:hypothetical protein
VSVFKPRDPPDGLPLVLFICDPRSSISDYAPFLALLAAEGYEVRAGEFFARDNRRFEGIFDSRPFRVFYAQAEFLFFPKMFAARAAELEYSAARDAEALITLYGTEAARQGRRVFLASDSNGDVLAAEAKKYAFVAGSGVFTLGPREGFGCIAQTNPLLAFYFKTPRDEKLSVPRLSAARGGFILGEKR